MNEEETQPPGIYIPEELASTQGVPDDLDAEAIGPYSVPDVARRRRASLVYVVSAVVVGVGVALGLPVGMLAMGIGFLLIAVYHWLAGWHLRVRESAALEEASRVSEFAVGHASAAVNFSGWRSRPIWNVLIFAADEPPSARGLVRVDAVDGHVVETYFESIPVQ